MPAPQPETLRELLLQDWGTDLAISGGRGQSREDPIIVEHSDPTEIAKTQLLTLRGLGKGRKIFWRTLGCTQLGNEWPDVERYKIETVELTEKQIVTQTENYYFRASPSKILLQPPPFRAAPYVHSNGIVVPYEIGHLHFDQLIDNESSEKGAGTSLMFSAPSVKATVYLYDRGRSTISDDIDSSRVRNEFEDACAELILVHPDYVPWPDRSYETSLRRYFRTTEEGASASLLLLTTAKNCYVKTRVTWPRDEFVDNAVNLFINELVSLVRSSPTIQ